MKRVYPDRDEDLIFQVIYDEENIDNFKLTFKTIGEASFTKTKAQLEEDMIKLSSTELKTLPDGVLRCYATITSLDSVFPDDTYDDIQYIETDYYIYHG